MDHYWTTTSTGPLLDHYWTTTGPLVGHYWTTNGPPLGHYWTTTGPLLNLYWTSTGSLLDHYKTTIGLLLNRNLDHHWTTIASTHAHSHRHVLSVCKLLPPPPFLFVFLC
jgi:hypothetical protein